jgi:hypothetical protein
MVNIPFYFPLGRLDLSIEVIKSRRMRSAEHGTLMRDRRSNYRVLVGKHEGKKPFGRPRRRWEE